MKDFTEQAKNNGVDLTTVGPCQFCGSSTSRGVFECMEIYNNNVLLFEYNLSEINQTRFLIVDAHALQHPELHGRWNNHFHLTRLCLILDKKIKWDYKLSPLLSEYIDEYKKTHSDEIVSTPAKLKRGGITAKEISLTKNEQEYVGLVETWANSVYSAYATSHKLILNIAEDFTKHKIL